MVEHAFEVKKPVIDKDLLSSIHLLFNSLCTYHKIYEEVSTVICKQNLLCIWTFFNIFVNVSELYPPTVAAPLSRLWQHWPHVPYVHFHFSGLEKFVYSGLEKVIFAWFDHSQNLYTNEILFRDYNAIDRILKFTFGFS